jgi:hypothetical protein
MDNWKTINKVLKYLIYILNYRLHYIRYLVVLEGYNNANWIYDTKDSKSTSEYIFKLREAIMSSKSCKKICIAKYLMELKFITFDNVGEEVGWLWNFLDDISC